MRGEKAFLKVGVSCPPGCRNSERARPSSGARIRKAQIQAGLPAVGFADDGRNLMAKSERDGKFAVHFITSSTYQA